MNLQEAIQEWKKLGIKRAEFNYDCGGDSMNDTSITLYGDNDTVINSADLEGYFDDEVYKKVTFYEASDGHYQGESGQVNIELDEHDDVEEDSFVYNKNGTAEWSEQFTEEIKIKLTAEQIAFIDTNVININGGDETFTNINFKRDFIMSDDDERVMNEIDTLIVKKTDEYEFKEAEGEPSDWYNFTTNEEGDELKIDEGYLVVYVTRTFAVYNEADW